jgi:hypothetical protein
MSADAIAEAIVRMIPAIMTFALAIIALAHSIRLEKRVRELEAKLAKSPSNTA